MEKYTLKRGIPQIRVEAKSFSGGVPEAHQTLYRLIGDYNRMFFGLSHPENGSGIVYNAAAEKAFEGEARQLSCASRPY